MHELEKVLESIRDQITVCVGGQALKGNVVGRYGTHLKLRVPSQQLPNQIGLSGMVEINVPYSAIEWWLGG
jgi:hypothetical protein